jgi:phenylacetate-CoA ligase
VERIDGREIESIWNKLATDVYGLSEIIGPGVAQECTHKDGLHIFSDVFYPEVINPKTGESAAEGEDGELTITTLTKQGIPLIRYGTRDVVSIRYDTCRCGRTSPRISKIKGRTDDMIVVRGINVFPSDRACPRRHRRHAAALPNHRGSPGAPAR